MLVTCGAKWLPLLFIQHSLGQCEPLAVRRARLLCLQVVWLDVIVAKARYGRWIEGAFPRFAPFPSRHAPGMHKGTAKAANPGESSEYCIQLRRLRCTPSLPEIDCSADLPAQRGHANVTDKNLALQAQPSLVLSRKNRW